MAKPDRKYLSEFAVSLFSARWIIFPSNEIASDGVMNAESAKVSERCHIYLICRRPACAFDPETFSFDGQHIKGNLIYSVAGEVKSVQFESSFGLLDGASTVKVSPYPHRELQTFTPDGEAVRRLPANSLSIAGDVVEKVLRELEVLYVGQAYAEGNRSALDRLKSHSTLQKILADIQYSKPDDEVLVLTFEYAPYRVITSFDGTDQKAIRDESDTLRFVSILDNPLTGHQQICLAEAGLIRYFQPEYNKIYKSSFPASDQKVLQDCYQLDFSALVTEINTEDLNLSLYSTTVPLNTHHIAQFDLVDPEKRRSFFTFVDRDGKARDMPNVIPPSR